MEAQVERCPICTSHSATVAAPNGYLLCATCGNRYRFKFHTRESLAQWMHGFALSGMYDATKREARRIKAKGWYDTFISTCGEPAVKNAWDIGCACGFSLTPFYGDGWSVGGNDLSKGQIERARTDMGGQFFNGYFEDVPESMIGNVSLFIFWNSLEHLHSPNETFAALRKVSTSPHYVFIEVPTKTDEQMVAHNEGPHSVEFTPVGLRRFLDGNGYKVVYWKEFKPGNGEADYTVCIGKAQ